ncbi:hypothetical protein E2L06_11060 [Haloterrigena sp. H1]|uniref:hypothetical protein n=1 Tax=Haloterrigena sp. H1 TaxID=2552943 RepID=UPI00110EED2D|nr:hypothetical protein [Haloterrigena sp. H1]TMT87089.1 hypothetical protein E2L06_11060 [Haloterrigena sp. H1]
MSDNTDSSRSTIDRRSILVSGGTTLAGLGTLAAVQTAAAQRDHEWPVGGSHGGNGHHEGEGAQDREHVTDGQEYEDQQTVTDDTGTIEVTIPAAWSDVDTAPASIGPSIWAAPDLEAFIASWDVPGIEVYTTTELGSDLEDALDQYLEELEVGEQCTDGGQRLFVSDEYVFLGQLFYQCGDSDTLFLAMAGTPADESTFDMPDGNMTSNGNMTSDRHGMAGTQGPQNETSNGNTTQGGGIGSVFPGSQSEIPDDQIPSDAPYVILFGAQIVTGPDLEAALIALDSLEAQSPDAENA